MTTANEEERKKKTRLLETGVGYRHIGKAN